MTTAQHPLVSAIIPTRNRPEQVVQAVRSALAQTYPALEVIVIVDGPDAATVSLLSEISDSRLRVHELPESLGGGGARNKGVELSAGEWIAFLDDDDVWLPDKTEKQVAAAREQDFQVPIITCRVIARAPQQDHLWPLNVFDGSGPVADYLFCRPLGQVSGLIQTSSLLIRRDWLLKVPFPAIKRHQDYDWILQAVDVEKARVLMLPEALAVWHIDQDKGSISNLSDPEYSLGWAAGRSGQMSKAAVFGFVNTHVIRQYPQRGFKNLQRLVSYLRPYTSSPKDWRNFLVLWFVPADMGQRLRRIVARRPGGKANA
ncbi:glycosyltransferase family 2 protein [Deinococcus sp.]|uniref:glycosyltransferase family 2 protein n=1 Tax=Deinococcus sp. TaxID=47478 RepID=UPI003B5955CF